jgi:hypothetical protein
MLARAYGRQ